MHETSQIITAIRKLLLHLSAFYSTFPVRSLKSIVNIGIQKGSKQIDVATWITLTKLNEAHNAYSRMYSHTVIVANMIHICNIKHTYYINTIDCLVQYWRLLRRSRGGLLCIFTMQYSLILYIM